VRPWMVKPIEIHSIAVNSRVWISRSHRSLRHCEQALQARSHYLAPQTLENSALPCKGAEDLERGSHG